jgi:2,4-dienoyl-CoA reductase-like NADH-dependent reductase (Old Yellow Enzyme family)/thioredoxin reductase
LKCKALIIFKREFQEKGLKRMNHRYSHILSPLRVRNRVLKDRLLGSKCASMLLQGPENYPAEGTIRFYEDMARNGAATVCVSMGSYPDKDGKLPPMSSYDMSKHEVSFYFSNLVDRIHAYGSLASASMQNVEPHDVGICHIDNWDEIPKLGDYSRNLENRPTISEERIQEMIHDFAFQAREFKRMGFDMVTIYMSYRGSILANSLSPLLNQRTDAYGGTPENRMRLSLDVFQAIREACGEDFLIECQVSPTEEEPGYTFEDFMAFAEKAQEYVDIFQLRAWEGALNHGNGFNQKEHEPYTLQFAAEMKKRGIRAVVSPVGVFQNPDDIEQFIADGKCDTVSLARAFICDPNYGQKILEERPEDIVPCLRCNNCHGARCSVNPRNGFSHVMDGMFAAAPAHQRKVAVIGGGPAGMVAALTAAQRGHRVTLFEKSDRLGGQLNHVDYMQFKWPLRNYRDYLIRQVEKAAIHVHLNMVPEAELMQKAGYEVVIAACGANGTVPASVPGAENAMLPMDALGNDKVGHKVVVVGGAWIGFEVGLALADMGHEVTVLSRGNHFPCDWHALKATRDYMDARPNFHYNCHCVTTEVGANSVTYTLNGESCTIEADTVIFSGGRAPELDSALSYRNVAPQFRIIGDGNRPASVKEAVYAGYTAAMQII